MPPRSAPKRSQRAKHKVEEADEEVQQLETELEKLQKANADLETRNTILEKYLQLQEPPAQPALSGDEWWLDAQTRAFIDQVFDPNQTITFTVCESRPLKLSRAEIASLSQEQYFMLYKMMVDAFTATLMASKGEFVKGSAYAQRLERLCFESGALRALVAVSHPSRAFGYHLAIISDVPHREAVEAWRSALKTMQLTAEQRRQILELRRRYLRRAGAIVHDRQRIASQLQASYPHGDFNYQSAFNYIQTDNAVEELQKNLCAELCSCLQFQFVLWKNCLTSLQIAVAFSRCAPRFTIDLIDICNILAEEDGAQSVADLISSPAEAIGDEILAIQAAGARIDQRAEGAMSS